MNTICYAYLSGDVGIQTEWFDFPTNPNLCDTLDFSVRVTNVRQLLLLDLDPSFLIPPGITVIPNSWQAAYPGGPTTTGVLQAIPDPDVVNGNVFSYSDDALWSSFIDQFGLEGVSAANAFQDSNKVAFTFRAVTNLSLIHI